MALPYCLSKVIVLMDPENDSPAGCYMVDNHPTESSYEGTNHMTLYTQHNTRASFTPMNMDGEYSFVNPQITSWGNSGAWGYMPLPTKQTTEDGVEVWVAEIGGDRGQTYPVYCICNPGNGKASYRINFNIKVN